ncbi:unnamed protein product [Lactuca virosa]|uniref:ubiquitinyl hydrolase 1 n=1 Tax=Lactuca virosa TaxID=75947 RepID=A0AAU9LIV1_9ASTR|nr:unnamed protein product [Lactuca virosa]
MAGFQLQMTWQTSLLLKKRKNDPPLGFKNLGNTCYLNAVLQCLTYTPPLANFCLRIQHSENCKFLAHQDKKSDCPFCLLEKRIVRSLSIDSTLDTPGKIIGGLKVFAEHFRLGRQEDANEFLRYVIDACHTTCLRLKKLQQQRRKYVSNGGGDGFNGSTVVKEIFGGALQSQVKCLACGNESNKRLEGIFDGNIDKSIAFEEVLVLSSFMCKTSQVPATSNKGAGPSMLEGRSGYGSTMQYSPKFTSGDYPATTQKYGQKGEKMLTDYPSGREIDSHMLKEQVHILGEICKMSHLFGLLTPLLLVINISISTMPRTAPCPVIKVEKIPLTFQSEEHYFRSFVYPFLEETRKELDSSMKMMYKATFSKIYSFKKAKGKEKTMYDVTFGNWRNTER